MSGNVYYVPWVRLLFSSEQIPAVDSSLLQTILTADGKEIIIRDIIKRFGDSSRQTVWSGKPRLFFIQACRTQRPNHLPPIVDQDVKETDLSSNMLVAYSCSPSEASIRDKKDGSVFVQMLCTSIFYWGDR